MGQLNRFKSLWRGEVQLWKTFWLFEVAMLFLSSFTFIASQRSIASALGKTSKAPLFVDYFLTLIFLAYGIFIIVAVWRSAAKYQRSRIWQFLARLSGIIVVLWLVTNLGIYIVIKTIIPPAVESRMDHVPQKLSLAESNIQADTFYMGEVKLKFPFYKEEIKDVSPFLHEDRIFLITMFLANNSGKPFKGTVTFERISLSAEPEEAVTTRILNWLLANHYQSLVETMRKVHYARLGEFSWWNLRRNIRLLPFLMLKWMSISAGDPGSLAVYETESPYIKGILEDRLMQNNVHLIDFKFDRGQKSYSLSGFALDEKVAKSVKDMISTIQPVNDINIGYKEIEALYKHKDKARYPEELLLLSLISMKGPTISNMTDLLRLEEGKENHQQAVNSIKDQIVFLSRAKSHDSK